VSKQRKEVSKVISRRKKSRTTTQIPYREALTHSDPAAPAPIAPFLTWQSRQGLMHFPYQVFDDKGKRGRAPSTSWACYWSSLASPAEQAWASKALGLLETNLDRAMLNIAFLGLPSFPIGRCAVHAVLCRWAWCLDRSMDLDGLYCGWLYL
jgi:hypothetical protein